MPGLSNENQFQSENEFLILFYKTFRAYYISLFYLANKKYKEAIGFFFRVEKYVKQIEASLNALDKTCELYKQKNTFVEQKDHLVKELNQSKYKIQTAAILEVSTNENEVSSVGKENFDKIVNYKNWK